MHCIACVAPGNDSDYATHIAISHRHMFAHTGYFSLEASEQRVPVNLPHNIGPGDHREPQFLDLSSLPDQ
ncbi:hypothetical protein IG631_23500 [Alternaria alternata]|nr:hypothetical protein IG631_23500 [Alternaria alternata]